jgi:hypothetical protein
VITAAEGSRQAVSGASGARRRPRVSRAAGGIAAAIVFALIILYVVSMIAGAMGHTMSGDTGLPQDGAASDAAPPTTGGQMVMSDGSVMGTDEHPSESPGTAVTEADHDGSAPAEADHQTEMGAAVNWYVIGGILALVAAGIALAAGIKEHLARRIATGALVTNGVCNE